MPTIKGLSKLVAAPSGTTLAKEARQSRARAARAARIATIQTELETGETGERKRLSASMIVDRVLYLARFGLAAKPGSKYRWENARGMIMAAVQAANDKPGARLPPIEWFLVAKSFGFSTEGS